MTEGQLLDKFTVRHFPADARKKLNLYCIQHETEQAVVLAQALKEYLDKQGQIRLDPS